MGNVSTVYNNIKNANEYMNEAKDYDIYVSKKIAEMNRASAYIESVEAHLVEEEQILNALHDSIRFNRNLQYKEIAVQLHRMISEYVMSENSQINSAYLDAINKIKQCIGCS